MHINHSVAFVNEDSCSFLARILPQVSSQPLGHVLPQFRKRIQFVSFSLPLLPFLPPAFMHRNPIVLVVFPSPPPTSPPSPWFLELVLPSSAKPRAISYYPPAFQAPSCSCLHEAFVVPPSCFSCFIFSAKAIACSITISSCPPPPLSLLTLVFIMRKFVRAQVVILQSMGPNVPSTASTGSSMKITSKENLVTHGLYFCIFLMFSTQVQVRTYGLVSSKLGT